MQCSVFKKINHHPLQHHDSTYKIRHSHWSSLTDSFLWYYAISTLNESHNSKYVVIKMCLFIQENQSWSKKLKDLEQYKEKCKRCESFTTTSGWVAAVLQLRERQQSDTHAVSWVVLHLKVWHIIWKRKQTKIAVLSDCRHRFGSSRWALSSLYHQFSFSHRSTQRAERSWLNPDLLPTALFFEWFTVWTAASRNSRLLSFSGIFSSLKAGYF